jgi:hypothetical protein
MLNFTNWLSQTSLSLAIQIHLWIIPLVQCIHIVAFCVASISVFMIALRVVGIAGSYMSLRQTLDRFIPPMFASLCIALLTGAFMVIGEPTRDLMSFSFWAKMSLLAIATLTTFLFQKAALGNETYWQEVAIQSWVTKSAALLTILIWLGVIVMGRLIAYDSIWGALSRVPRD